MKHFQLKSLAELTLEEQQHIIAGSSGRDCHCHCNCSCSCPLDANDSGVDSNRMTANCLMRSMNNQAGD